MKTSRSFAKFSHAKLLQNFYGLKGLRLKSLPKLCKTLSNTRRSFARDLKFIPDLVNNITEVLKHQGVLLSSHSQKFKIHFYVQTSGIILRFWFLPKLCKTLSNTRRSFARDLKFITDLGYTLTEVWKHLGVLQSSHRQNYSKIFMGLRGLGYSPYQSYIKLYQIQEGVMLEIWNLYQTSLIT